MGTIYSIQVTVYGNVVEREALLAEFGKDDDKRKVSCFADGHISIISFESNLEPNQEWLNILKQNYPTFSHINVSWSNQSRYLSSDEKKLSLITAEEGELNAIRKELEYVNKLFKINATNEELRSIANDMQTESRRVLKIDL